MRGCGQGGAAAGNGLSARDPIEITSDGPEVTIIEISDDEDENDSDAFVDMLLEKHEELRQRGKDQSVLSLLKPEFKKLSSEEDERSTAEKFAVFDALKLDTADAAIKELDLFTVDARRAYDELMEKAKFEATVEEFVSLDDQPVLRSLMLRQDLLEVFKGERKPNLAFGAVDLSAEPKIDAEVGKLKKQTDIVFDAAVSEIRSYGNSALLQLRGEGVRRQIQAVSGSIAESADAISSDISAGLSDAIHATKVKLGLEDDPSLLSSLSNAADKKARAAASAAGASVSPETPREYAESVAADLPSAAGQATDAVKDAGAGASSLLHTATRSVASAVGASVTPETREEYVEAAQASASSVAQAARSSVAAGVEAVQSSVAAGAEAVQSFVVADAELVQSSVVAGVEAVQSGVAAGAAAIQSGAASAYADASAGASAAFAPASILLHRATRSAASAAGDQAESINDAIRSVGAEAVNAAGSGIHHATRLIASAVVATPLPESASEYAEYASKKAGDAYASTASFVGGAASKLSEPPRAQTPHPSCTRARPPSRWPHARNYGS
ncbi:hypothetical protein OC844_007882 [Tilletia horrida]|nr:hypothetical protein OC844_007882 [Tilletia horrida]